MDPNSSFISSFVSHWRLPKQHTEALLGRALIVLDTSVLLDLYRVTSGARTEMLRVLTMLQERIWIPHQVAVEFHRNRISAAKDQLDFYPATCKELEKLKNQTLQKINEFAKRCALNAEERRLLKGSLEGSFRAAVENIRQYEGKFDLSLGQILNDDPVLSELSKILDGRVGPAFDAEKMQSALEEAARRKEARIPPGYKDSRKYSNSEGDYIWWEQTLIEAQARKMPVLIVSDDAKEDWVNAELNFAVGPREELVTEMRDRASTSLLILPFAAFLEAAKGHLQTAVSQQTLNQAKMASRREISGDSRPFRIPTALLDAIREEYRMDIESQRENHREAEQKLNSIGLEDLDERDLLKSEIIGAEIGTSISTERLEEFEDALAKGYQDGDHMVVEMTNNGRTSILRQVGFIREFRLGEKR